MLDNLTQRLGRVMKQLRGWSRPSDHVPVTATMEV